ncbi:hypothetical protein [Arcticibacter sp. MXS-1]|uniref:hypothetical protein n=1 Tax=Arcticibacter sp. MXS-1 TaxID=3341726 RepID=UPI0035A8FCBE
MAKFKFGDKVITPEGKGTVEMSEDDGSGEVKVQLQGDDVFKIYKEDELSLDSDSDYDQEK